MTSQHERVLEVVGRLKEEYGSAKIALKYGNRLQLLVAVMLSAQCTDERVNKVTEKLFKKYGGARDFAEADLGGLMGDIRPTGFFRQKAKNIQNACRIIIDKHGGRVPETMGELTELPGVARKTANIVLANAFNVVEGIAVDTHVRRLSRRLGFTENTDPNKIERDLMELIPKSLWNKITYLLIDHGRAVCKAPTPLCSRCVLEDLCLKVGVVRRK